MVKMQITKSTDGHWKLPHKTSPLSGYQEPAKRQLTVTHDW